MDSFHSTGDWLLTSIKAMLMSSPLACLPLPSDDDGKRSAKVFNDGLKSLKLLSDSESGDLLSSAKESLAPLYFNRDMVIGYDRVSQRWENLFSLKYASYDPADPKVVMDFFTDWRPKCVAGSMICWMSRAFNLNCFYDSDFEIWVTNPLNKTVKKLPPRPDMSQPPDFVHMVLESDRPTPDSYKVLLFTQTGRLSSESISIRIEIYDSRCSSWSSTESTVSTAEDLPILSEEPVPYSSVYCNGSVYFLMGEGNEEPFDFFAYNVKEKTWTKHAHPFNDLRQSLKAPGFLQSKIVVCGPELYIVLMVPKEPHGGQNTTGKECIMIYKVDSDTSCVVEVFNGAESSVASKPLIFPSVDKIASDEQFIYFQGRYPKSRITVYDTRTQEWSSIPSPFSYNYPRRSKQGPDHRDYSWTQFCLSPAVTTSLKA